ncbi:MAG: hypothetical protein IKN73_02070 [Alphaproteobacteria bacterium]|nr:hypothetical protein [Alphaproteobacteria bacterium]
MKAQTQFDSENFLMSVFGHLVLILIIVLSFGSVIDKAKLVTPNRIQIIEIDLKNVKIMGEETKLYNTVKPEEKNDQKDTQKTETKKDSSEKKIDIKQPTMVENESKKTTEENKAKKTEKKTEDKPVPRKKMTVKVNREVLSVDRTMTISVVDALRVALTRCWNIDTTRPDMEDIRLTAHLKLLPTGVVDRIWFESESRAETDSVFAYVLETAKEAIKTCSPFSMLPRSEYNTWKDTSVTFYPSQGKVM